MPPQGFAAYAYCLMCPGREAFTTTPPDAEAQRVHAWQAHGVRGRHTAEAIKAPGGSTTAVYLLPDGRQWMAVIGG
ncbi:MAG: hypothetical protein IIC30_00180 [Chloroflexi bacterium]|nr:hypothetical protein [Chloroflexota bacterium]